MCLVISPTVAGTLTVTHVSQRRGPKSKTRTLTFEVVLDVGESKLEELYNTINENLIDILHSLLIRIQEAANSSGRLPSRRGDLLNRIKHHLQELDYEPHDATKKVIHTDVFIRSSTRFTMFYGPQL
jgi:hypothetical protein